MQDTPKKMASFRDFVRSKNGSAYGARTRAPAFAGLRVSEINRLSWGDVDLTGGFIHVSAANSKTRTRRLVPIQANLKAWLEPIAKTKGPIINGTVNPKTVRPRSAGGTFGKTGEPGTFRRRHAAVIKAAGLTK